MGGGGAGAGLIWLGIETGGRLLCMRDPVKCGEFVDLAENVLASQEGLCSKEFVICIGCTCTIFSERPV
jgi:hypothetical protein